MTKINLAISIFIIVLVGTTRSSSQDQESRLELVHVFFRHGARTPELKDVYPNDPYKIDAFLPMGWGQLTNLGKQQAYKLGQVLRRRYGTFLGDTYYSEIVHAQSTDYDRTKVSALLVLAGLFPPKEKQMWNEDLPWLPIPLAYEKNSQDYFLRRPLHYCPTYVKEIDRVFESDDTVTLLKEYQDTFDYLTNHTGKPIINFSNVMGLYQTLTAETNMNLTLPEWTKSVYPDIITEMAVKQCVLENSTPLLKKMNGGRSLQKVIEHIMAKSTDSLSPPERKIFLYSGHENNVLNILSALDLFDPHFPNYSSATIIELHSLGGRNFAIKILYLGNLDKEPEEKKLHGCDVMCPLDKFLTVVKPIVPGNFTAECESPVHLD